MRSTMRSTVRSTGRFCVHVDFERPERMATSLLKVNNSDTTSTGSSNSFLFELPRDVTEASIAAVTLPGVRALRPTSALHADLPTAFSTQQTATLHLKDGSTTSVTLPPMLRAVSSWSGAPSSKGIQAVDGLSLDLGVTGMGTRLLLGLGQPWVSGTSTLEVTAVSDGAQYGAVSCTTAPSTETTMRLYSPPMTATEVKDYVNSALLAGTGASMRAHSEVVTNDGAARSDVYILDIPRIVQSTTTVDRVSFTPELEALMAGNFSIKLPLPHDTDLSVADMARHINFTAPSFTFDTLLRPTLGVADASVTEDVAEHTFVAMRLTGGSQASRRVAVSIPMGHYTPAVLVDELTAALAALSTPITTVTFAFDAATGLFTITETNGADLTVELSDARVRYAMGFDTEVLTGASRYATDRPRATTVSGADAATYLHGVTLEASHPYTAALTFNIAAAAQPAVSVLGPTTSASTAVAQVEVSSGVFKRTACTLGAGSPVALRSSSSGSLYFDTVASRTSAGVLTFTTMNDGGVRYTAWSLMGKVADVQGDAAVSGPRAQLSASNFSVAAVFRLPRTTKSPVLRSGEPLVVISKGVSILDSPRVYVRIAASNNKDTLGMPMNAGGEMAYFGNFARPPTVHVTPSRARGAHIMQCTVLDARDPTDKELATMIEGETTVLLNVVYASASASASASSMQ